MRRIVLVSGSLRDASTNTAVLRTAVVAAPGGISCVLYGGVADLPAFNPDDDRDPLHPEVRRLRDAVHEADALLFSTPEYAGALPGSFKNLLDWTIGDDQPGSIYEKPVAWCNTSPRGARAAHDELRTVLTYAHATIVDDACIDVPVTADVVGADGLVHDPATRHAIAGALGALAVLPEQA